MTDDPITALFARYRAAYEAGAAPDMAATLREAGEDAALLAAVLAEYHAATPAPLDLDVIEAIAASPAFAPTFGEVLRAAWTQQGMLRRLLVDRLVVELGLRPASRARLDERLHEVETGRHPAEQLSRRLLAALDQILPGVASALAGASSAAGDGMPSPAPMFARHGIELNMAAAAGPPVADEFPEVDELFQAD